MAKQQFTLQFDFEANMGPIKSSVAELQNSLKGITLPPNMAANFKKLFDNLESEMSNFQAMTKNGFENMADVNKAQTSFSKITKLVNQIGLETQKVKGIDPQKLLPKSSIDRVEKLEAAWKELKAQSEKREKASEKIEKQNQAIKDQIRLINELKTKKTGLKNENKEMGAQKGAAVTKRDAAVKSREKKVAERTALEGQKGGKSSAEYQALGQEIARLNGIIAAADKEINRLTTSINKNKTTMSSFDGQIDSAENELAGMKEKLDTLTKIDVDQNALTQLRQELANLLGLSLDEVSTDLDAIKRAITGVNSKELEKIDKSLAAAVQPAQKLDDALDQAKEGMRGFNQEAENTAKAASEIDSLKNSILQFFSLTNSVQLFKRAVSSAINTVKELDATMTEAAVVTNFSISDMWNKLPEYSEQAQKLGVSINGMYEATTLYYQQGLKTNEAMALGAETMKMARIAGLQSADATEAMTAALRGFNMELNETSATRVNDVYSQLAAVTASNVEQISTAMSKTASIASAANMEFETTAAFLAQIIETTQEAPETAGTALKTIVARFSEVKNLRQQGLSSGEDSEGEIIDVNKIQTALRSVGISMDKYFAGTEGLDEVLMRLAEKWGSLDFETQRYIATMAAGSRQQSRFIAMMSDYGRTQELVSAANNSAGASQKQYEKTLDSMETKLQQLKNAWDEFAMGLTNNEILKWAVDFLVKILEGVNSITEKLSGGNGLVKSIVTLTTTILALKGAAGALKGVFGGMKLSFSPAVNKESASKNDASAAKYGRSEAKSYWQAYNAEWDAGKQRLNAKQKTKYTGNKAKRKKAVGTQIKTEGAINSKNKTKKSIDGVSDSANKAGKEIDGLGEKTERTGEKMQVSGEKFAKLEKRTTSFAAGTQTAGRAMTYLGGTCMTLGLATTFLAEHFRNLGMDEAAESAETLGAILTGVGMAITVLGQIVPMVGSVFSAISKKLVADGIAVQAAWWEITLIVLAVVAVLALVAAAIAAVASSNKDNELEKQMQEAQEATDRAREAAKQAKAAYDELLRDRSEYGNLQEKLDSLTRGTQEWKETLIEANQQVLDLVSTYPELAEYMEKGTHGQLIITDEGWDKLIQLQQKSIQNSNAAVFSSQRVEADLSKDQLRKNLGGYTSTAGTTESYVREISEDQLRTIFSAMEENPDLWDATFLESGEVIYSQAMEELASTVHISKAELLSFKDALIETKGAFHKMDLAVDTYSMNAIQSTVSDETSAYEYGDAAITVGARHFEAASKVREDEIYNDLIVESGKNGGVAKDQAFFQELASEYNIKNTELTGNDEHDWEVLYAAMAGIDPSEIDDGLKGFENREKLLKEIARMQATRESATVADQVAFNMMKLPESKQRIYAAAQTGNFEFLNRDDLNDFKSLDLEQMAFDLGYGSAEAMAKAWEMELEDLVVFIDTASKDYETALNDLYARGDQVFGKGKTKQFLDQFQAQVGASLDFTQLDALSRSLRDIAVNGGDVEGMLPYMSKLTDGLTGDKLQQGINILANASWENTEAVDTTIEALRRLGVEIDEDLVKQLYKTSNAIKKVNLSSLRERIKSLDDTIKSTEEKLISGQKTFTTEERDSLIAAGISEGSFVSIGSDEWASIDSTNDILEKIQKNTLDILDEMRLSIEDQIDIGTKIDYVMDNKYTVGSGIAGSITGKILTGEQLIKELKEGTRDAVGVGSTNNIGTGELWRLATDMGINQQQLNGKSPSAVIDMVVSAWENYYGEGGLVLKQNLDTKNKMVKQEYQKEAAKKAGTEEFYQVSGFDRIVAQEALDKVSGEIIINEASQVVNKTRSEELRARGAIYQSLGIGIGSTGRVGQSEYRGTSLIDTKALLDAILADDSGDVYNKLRDDEDALMVMRQMAGVMGIDGGASMTFGELYKEMRRYNQVANDTSLDGTSQGKVLQGLINAQSGLGVVVETVTEQLDSQNSSFANSQLSVMNLVVAASNANKQMQKMGQTLSDQADALAIADKNSWKYCAALENISNMAKTVFGDKATTEFVDKNRELFSSLLSGGEVAQEAYRKLSELYTQETLNGTNFTMSQVREALSGALDNVNPGQAIDLVGYYNNLMAIQDMTEETAKRILESWGFSLVASEDWVTDEFGKIISGSISGIKVDASYFSEKFGDQAENWENPYDKFYNTYEKINTLIRQRDKLERQYNRLLEDRATSGADLLLNSQKEIANLQEQAKQQKKLMEGKQGQIDDLVSKNSGLASKYGISIDENGTISMNWAVVDAQKGTEEGEKIEEFVSKLEEYRDQMQEAEDALWDIEDSIAEIRERGKDQYLGVEDRIKEALITERQEEIDKLSAINDSINDANSKMLDAMQQQIDEYRQSRDNEKTENEIADKQARLAYLQQDTSGANATEILKLEKEIAEAQESHIDNLIDQKINELQEQNDKAAEQRERQIQIMEAQLKQYDESGAVWDDVYRLWEEGTTKDGKLLEGSPLETLLKTAEGFEGLSRLGQKDWMNDLTQSIIEGWAFVNGLVKAKSGQEATFRAANGSMVSGTANENGDIVANGKVYGSVYQNNQGDWVQATNGSMLTEEEYAIKNRQKVSTIPEMLKYGMKGENVKILQRALKDLGYYDGEIDGNFGNKTLKAVKAFQKDNKITQTGNVANQTKAAFAAKQYKTGGLADYTGPAWLDGTKTKPELVLNARDTQNFIQLKDILASLMGSTPSKSSEKAGETTYDIDINVETIKDETDLDMIANYIENKIVASANYRNNTIIGGRR